MQETQWQIYHQRARGCCNTQTRCSWPGQLGEEASIDDAAAEAEEEAEDFIFRDSNSGRVWLIRNNLKRERERSLRNKDLCEGVESCIKKYE